jgi:hypothetical protein
VYHLLGKIAFSIRAADRKPGAVGRIGAADRKPRAVAGRMLGVVGRTVRADRTAAAATCRAEEQRSRNYHPG